MGIDRKTLFKSLGVIKDGPQLSILTEEAFTSRGIDEWQNDNHLTTSFYCSSYPGAERNCRCTPMYRLLNIPQSKPMDAKGVGVVNVGKAVEEIIVESWHKAGMLLSSYPDQIYITDEETWLTGYIDAVLNLLPEYSYVLPVEIKSKKNNVIEYMKVGGQTYDQKHYYQLQSYIQWCRNNHEKRGWDKLGLLPAKGGIIYYVSREDPLNSHQFYVDYDWETCQLAEYNLKQWKESFLNDELPIRPKEWRWTEGECKWNPYKPICKQDYKDGIVNLSQSNAVKFALEQDPSYNLEEIKRRVKERWMFKQLKLF